MLEFRVDKSIWHSKTVAGIFIERAIAILEDAVAQGGLDTRKALDYSASGKTLATVIDELLPGTPQTYSITSVLREERSDWTFESNDVFTRIQAFSRAVQLLRKLQEEHQRQQFTRI